MNTQATSTTPAPSGLQKFYRDALYDAGNALDLACTVINQLAALFTVLAMGRPSARTSTALAGLGQYIAQDSFDMTNDQRAAVWKALGTHDTAGEPGYCGRGRHGIGPAAEAPLPVMSAQPQNPGDLRRSAEHALAAGITAIERVPEPDLEEIIREMRGAAWGMNCALQQGSADHLIDACMSSLTASADRLGRTFRAHMDALHAEQVARDKASGRRFDLRATDSGADMLLLEHKLHTTVRFDGADAVMQAERAGRDWLRGVDVPAMALTQKDAWRNAA